MAFGGKRKPGALHVRKATVYELDEYRNTMLELEKWAKDKNRVVAMLAMQSATFAEYLIEILSYVRNQEHIEGFELPDPKKWPGVLAPAPAPPPQSPAA